MPKCKHRKRETVANHKLGPTCEKWYKLFSDLDTCVHQCPRAKVGLPVFFSNYSKNLLQETLLQQTVKRGILMKTVWLVFLCLPCHQQCIQENLIARDMSPGSLEVPLVTRFCCNWLHTAKGISMGFDSYPVANFYSFLFNSTTLLLFFLCYRPFYEQFHWHWTATVLLYGPSNVFCLKGTLKWYVTVTGLLAEIVVWSP